MAAANKTILKPADLLAVGLRGTRPPQEKYMSAFFLQRKSKKAATSAAEIFLKSLRRLSQSRRLKFKDSVSDGLVRDIHRLMLLGFLNFNDPH